MAYPNWVLQDPADPGTSNGALLGRQSMPEAPAPPPAPPSGYSPLPPPPPPGQDQDSRLQNLESSGFVRPGQLDPTLPKYQKPEQDTYNPDTSGPILGFTSRPAGSPPMVGATRTKPTNIPEVQVRGQVARPDTGRPSGPSSMDRADQERLSSLDETEWAMGEQGRISREMAAQRSQMLQDQSQEIARNAKLHDQAYEEGIRKIDLLQREAASRKIDPERWYKNLSTGQSVGWNLAAALAGASAGWNHQTGNLAIEQMSKHVDRDIAAQREDIESGRVAVQDARGILGETYRRYGNMDQAVQAANVLSLQKIDADAQQLQSGITSATGIARIGEVRASLMQDIAARKAALAAAGSRAGASQANKEHEDVVALLKEAASNGRDMTYQQGLSIVRGTGTGTGVMSKAPKDGALKKDQQQLALSALDENIDAIDQYEQARKDSLLGDAPIIGASGPLRDAESRLKSAQLVTMQNVHGVRATKAHQETAGAGVPSTYTRGGDESLEDMRARLVRQREDVKSGRMGIPASPPPPQSVEE